jgi:hypothetical protein
MSAIYDISPERGGSPLPARASRSLVALIVTLALAFPLLPAHAQEEFPVRVRAEFLRFDRARNLVHARGSVIVTYQDLTLRADEVLLDLTDLELVARGNVVLEEGGQVVTAGQMTYNLRTRFGSLDVAETRWTDRLALDPIHIRAARIEGNINQRLCVQDAQVTTCDLDDPLVPYKLTAEQIELIPQDRLVMRNVSLYLFGRRILTLPFFILFLRDPRQQRIFPLVGWNETEGFFVRTTTTYSINDEHYGFFFLDWMERFGFGSGFEHIWRYDRGEGNYFLYVLGNRQTAANDYRARLQHRHNFGEGFAAGVLLDYYRRQFGDGTFTSGLYGTLDALYRDAAQTANLFTFYTRTDGHEFPTEQLSARLSYDRQFLPNLRGRIDLPYFQNIFSGLGPDLEMTPRLELNFFGAGYTLQAVAEHRFDLDGEAFPGDRFYSLSRLPEIIFTAFARPLRLGDVNLTYQLTGGLGYFVENDVFVSAIGELRTVSAIRLDAQALLSGSQQIGAGTTADLRLVTRASYYSTGDFRAVLGGTTGISHRFSGSLSGRLTYNYQDNFGTTPFQFDRDVTRLHNVLLNLSYREATLGADLLTSYNILTGRADPITLRVEWLPIPNWTVNLATAFDPVAGSFTTLEGQLRARLSDQWELFYRAVYTPATGEILHDRVQLTYFQYCWAATFSYLGARREFWLEVWLTAFPQARGAVGVGNTGVLFQQPFLPPSPVR